MTWSEFLQALNTAALAAFAGLMAKGYLVPMPTVERYMLSPREDRIAALEAVSKKRDEQFVELFKAQAAAIEAQSQALSLLHQQQQQGRGGD